MLNKIIILLTTVQVIAKITAWIVLGWLSILTVLYINENGLKALLDAIWLGA